MTNTTTLENVITEVHHDSINHFDEVMPIHEMHFDSLKQMWISGKQIDIALSAQHLLSNRLRVPYSYLSRCPDDLQAHNLNFWIKQEAQHRDTFSAGSMEIHFVLSLPKDINRWTIWKSCHN